MASLGKLRCRSVYEPGEKPEEGGRIYYRDPTTEEWTSFQGEMAEIMSGERKGERLVQLCHRYGATLIERVEGFDVPDGMNQRDALFEFAAPVVSKIGEETFIGDSGRKVLNLGKSERPPGSATREGSAGSSNGPASTSRSSTKRTTTSSVGRPAPLDGSA